MSVVDQNHGSDFLLVLGHALNPDGTPKPELVTRLETALDASELRPTAKLIVSGGCQSDGLSEAEVMKNWLERNGVAGSRILMEPDSRDTVENIIMSTTLLTQLKAQSVCLITGTDHMDRALCLLLSHLRIINEKMDVSHLMPTSNDAKRTSKESLIRERLLLFKDLGRVFGMWQNRDWNQPSQSTLMPSLKTDATHSARNPSGIGATFSACACNHPIS